MAPTYSPSWTLDRAKDVLYCTRYNDDGSEQLITLEEYWAKRQLHRDAPKPPAPRAPEPPPLPPHLDLHQSHRAAERERHQHGRNIVHKPPALPKDAIGARVSEEALRGPATPDSFQDSGYDSVSDFSGKRKYQPSTTVASTIYEQSEEGDARNLEDQEKRPRDIMRAITSQLEENLSGPEPHAVSFVWEPNWATDLQAFCKSELDGGFDLSHVLTLTGTSDAAYATSCRQYMLTTWGEQPWDVLSLLAVALCNKTERWQHPTDPNTTLEISIHNARARANVCATTAQLVIIAQQLAWITACFRRNDSGSLCASQVNFARSDRRDFTISLAELNPVEPSPSGCWHPLFAKNRIAASFPIPPRAREGFRKGLELPFHLMLTLAGIWYPIEYEQRVVLRGYSKALIPISRSQDSIQWHYITGREASTSIQFIQDYLASNEEDPSIVQESDVTELAKSERHFLGFCEEAEIHLATEGSRYGQIKQSYAERESKRVVVDQALNVTVVGSIISLAALQAQIPLRLENGAKVDLIASDRDAEDWLAESSERASVVYDIQHGRGWLVPEASVALHMVLSWSTVTQFGYDPGTIPHASPAIRNAAEEVMLHHLRTVDTPVKRRKARNEETYFGDLVKQIYLMLQHRKDAARAATSSWTVRNHFRYYLHGWDLWDITNRAARAYRRQHALRTTSHGKTWADLQADPEVLVFFGRDLGDIIQPRTQIPSRLCSYMRPNTLGEDCMIASIPCIMNLTRQARTNRDDDRTHLDYPRLSTELYCRPGKESILTGSCRARTAHCCRLHNLDKHRPKDPFTLNQQAPNGAIVFRGSADNTPTHTPGV